MGPILGGLPRLKYSDATANIVCDGNSLVSGQGGTPWPTQIRSLAPLNGVVNVTNVGQPGQTTRQMNGLDSSYTGVGDVDGAWVAGKTNVLILWEGTNSICNTGETGAQAASDMVDYITARQATHKWMVVLLTCIPRQAGSAAATLDQNARLDAYNAILAGTYRQMGARILVDVRGSGSPFAFADYSDATFAAAGSSGYWASGEDGGHIHLSTAGYAYIATIVAAALKRLPAR